MNTGLNWIDATKWAAAAGVVGALLAVVLPAAQSDQVITWGSTVEHVATAIAGAAAALVLALRSRRRI